MTLLRTCVAAWLLGLLGACASQPPAMVTGPSSAAKLHSSEFEELVAYLLQAKSMNAQMLGEETQRAREIWGRNKSDLMRLKLALALSNQGNSDDGELMSLLEPLLQEPGATKPELRALATLLHTATQERKRTKDNLHAAQTRLREALKNQESSQSRLDQQRKQIEELEKKIHALMNIEKSLIQRADKLPK